MLWVFIDQEDFEVDMARPPCATCRVLPNRCIKWLGIEPILALHYR